MNLRGIVAVSGKPGLFKVIGQNKSVFILESLDEQRLKLVANISTAKLASLEDITIFGEDEDLKLVDIFEKMKGTSVPDVKKVDGITLKRYFREIAPNHDEEKVYTSDMKKIITWYAILKDLPLFSETAPEAVEKTAKTTDPVIKEPAKAKKPRAKKTKKAEE